MIDKGTMRERADSEHDLNRISASGRGKSEIQGFFAALRMTTVFG
jgi:hypothetical protein